MFVFYFGILADLTPPVALACFAAAPIAKEKGLKISIEAVKIAMAGFVIPYMAVYSPALMLQNVSGQSLDMFVISVLYICLKVFIAIIFWGVAVIGYYKEKLSITERLFAIIIPALLITALPVSDEIGFSILAVFLFLRWLKIRKKNKIKA
jgi:TRAP-type uncharacterized transport system fused permease subunit